MSRRILATVVAALMVFALLPASSAFAQANATAQIAEADRVRFPGDHTYTVTVTNNEPQLIGRTINAVEIYLPVIGSGVVFNGAPPNQGAWTAHPTKVGSTQYVTYFGGTIAPQASATFQIPARVLRPFRADLSSDFVVKVSSNRFTSSNNATPPSGSPNALTAAVEVLEILDQPVPVAPCDAERNRGVCDNSGTGGYGQNALGRPVNGQTVTYAFQVKNHAREALSTTCSLQAQQAADTPGASVAQSIAGEGGEGTCEIPVTLGPAPTGNRTNTFAATAVAPNADAAGQNSPQFTVQRPVDFVFGAFEPRRVNSGEGSARQFNVTTQKLGGPEFDLNEGSLTFGANEASLADAPVTFGTGTRNTTLRYQISEISGADNDYTANIASSGEDYNLVQYSLDHELGLITIDNLIPTFDLDVPVLGDGGNDVDGDALVAATDNTRITLTGKAFGTAVENGHDLEAGTLSVWVQPDIGPIVEMDVTQTNEADGVSFTATTPASYPAWDDNASRFVVSASIEDQAGNLGSDATTFTPVDTDDPVLDASSAEVVAPRIIRVQFDDATGLRGACDPANWRVTNPNRQIAHVEAFNGETGDFENCTANEELERTLDPSGVRRLVLTADLSVDDTPDVAYDDGLSGPASSRLLGRIPAKDGAQNDAVDQAVTAATRLVPPAPDVLNPMRLDHETGDREPAYHDTEENRYFTNVGGADAIVASITGVRNGYLIQVVDANDNVVHEEEATNPGPLGTNEPLGNEWTQDITIPLGAADGAHIRGVRLVSAEPSRNLGDITFETFVVDTVLPTIGSGVQTGPSEGLANFAEKIVTIASDKTAHWRVRWEMEGQNGPETARSQPETVERIDLTTRRITWSFEVQSFEGFDYRLQPGTTDARYEDRAGNYMLDTFGSEPID